MEKIVGSALGLSAKRFLIEQGRMEKKVHRRCFFYGSFLLSFIFVFVICCLVCSLQPCDHLLEKG